MSATRFDTSSWLPGATLFGVAGFGVLGSQVESTGQNGPAYLYDDLNLPADGNEEVCGRITTFPSAGSFIAAEDTSFSFFAPDGVYTALYQLYVDGVAIGGLATITLSIGHVNPPPPPPVIYGPGNRRHMARNVAIQEDEEELVELVHMIASMGYLQ